MANASLDPIDILLELGFDLDDISDDESYLSAMKEAIATIEFKTQGKGDDRSRALREEVIKVTRQRRSKRTVDVNKVFKTKPKASTAVGPKLLAASKDYKEQKEEEEKQEKAVTAIIPAGLKRVSDGINDITKVLVRDLTAEKKQADEERKAAENLAAETEEKESEKQSQESAGNFLKGLKPPEIPFFDRIKQFFGNVLAGGLLSWLAKDENKDKVQGFADFIRDHGGKILTGILALVALDVGMKLIGFLGVLTPLVSALTALVTSPVFLAGTGIIMGAKAVADFGKKVELAGQELIGGKGTTEAGNEFSFADIQDLREERKTFMTQSGMSSEVIQQQSKPFDDLMDAMKKQKSINDELWNKKQAQASGDIRFDKEIPELERKKAEQQKLVTELFQKLNVTDQDLKQLQMREGRVEKDDTYIEKPLTGASGALRNLSENLGDAFSYMTGGDKNKKPEVMPKESLFEGASKVDSTMDTSADYMKGASFSYDETLEMSEESKQIIHGAPEAAPSTKPDDLTPEFKALEIHPESKRIQQELFSTPPKPMQVSVLPVSVPAKKPQVASSSAGQKTAPTFGSVDPNNTSVPMIAGVYNSPVAV